LPEPVIGNNSTGITYPFNKYCTSTFSPEWNFTLCIFIDEYEPSFVEDVVARIINIFANTRKNCEFGQQAWTQKTIRVGDAACTFLKIDSMTEIKFPNLLVDARSCSISSLFEDEPNHIRITPFR
jgi:hypothetical protein